jgi:hypothetical protein
MPITHIPHSRIPKHPLSYPEEAEGHVVFVLSHAPARLVSAYLYQTSTLLCLSTRWDAVMSPLFGGRAPMRPRATPTW